MILSSIDDNSSTTFMSICKDLIDCEFIVVPL